MISEASAKKCSKCHGTMPSDRFSRDKTRRDGLACWCKECLNASSRAWHAANRERVKERIRAWHKQNPLDAAGRADAVIRTRQWCEENPEKTRANRKTFKYRHRARMRGGMSAAELRAWEVAQRKVCHWCGAKCATYEIDHRTPLSKGGKHEARNLVISCRPCNRSKGARCPVEFAQSLGRLV